MFAVTLTVLSGILLVYWMVGLTRLIRTLVSIPTARRGLKLSAPMRRVCVVIPAHNEERVIAGLIESLRLQDYPDFRVVLSLDRCTDGTAAVARSAIGGDARFTVLEISECPEGWAGKVHALWRGAGIATDSELLLFIDADTRLEPRCLRASVALLEERGLDLLSLLSVLETDSWFERLVQPAASFELIRQYPLVNANRAKQRRAFANGQFMLFRRSAYERLGGHEAVKEELLEDLDLARRATMAGLSIGVFLSGGLLACRMYGSWADFQRGWRRIFTEAGNRRPSRIDRNALVLRLLGAVLPCVAVVTMLMAAGLMGDGDRSLGVAGFVIGAAALGMWVLMVGATYRLARAPLWAVPGFIVGSWLAGRLMFEAAADLRSGAEIEWGGRRYVRPAR